MASEELRQRAKALLDQLSTLPRVAGGTEESSARSACRRRLEINGLTCRECEFEFSRSPAMWGSPLAALAQALATCLLALVAMRNGPAVALLAAAVMFPALTLVSRWVRIHGTARLPWLRARAVNLEAVQGNPGVWLVAHLDSKSQTVPMIWRIASTVAAGAVTAAALGAGLLQLAGVESVGRVWPVVAVAALVTALPGVLCFVRGSSPGAVDNASGVVAVMLASEELSRASLPHGVLITSAEELGLAGARDWTEEKSSNPIMINCDTVDDEGLWYCMRTGARAHSLASGSLRAAARLGYPLRSRRLIPGILADSVAFTDAGMQSVTISRGTMRTLARIHTRGDTSAAMTAAGAADASLLLAALVKEIS